MYGGVSREEYAGLLSKMGCRLMRDHSIIKWIELEPEKGKYDFRISDYIVKTYGANNLGLMPVVLGTDFRFYAKGLSDPNGYYKGGLPKWLREISAKKDIWLNCNHHSNNSASLLDKYYLTLPPENIFRGFLTELATRYKGRIMQYEIMNEPNLYLSPDDYMKYLKPASDALHKVDKDINVVGFCVTGDLAGKGKSAEYLLPCFEQGGLNDADTLSFHPYDSRQLSSQNAADKMIGVYRSLMKKFGKQIPLWNTELFFLSEGSSDDKQFDLPQAAKRFLIDLGEGVGQSTCIQAEKIFKPRLLANSYRSENRHYVESIPSPVYVMYNALARMFEGAKPVDKIRWPGDCICYIYERDGKYIAAFWRYGQTKHLKVKLPFAVAGIELYDLFGNKLPVDGKPLLMSDDPYYIVCRGETDKDRANFLAALRKPPVESDIANTIKLRRILPSADGLVAYVDISNFSGGELTGVTEILGGNKQSDNGAQFRILQYKTETVKIPVQIKSGTLPERIILQVKTAKETVEKVLGIPPLLIAKSDKGEKTELKRIGRGHKIKPQIKAEFRVWHDDKNIRFEIVVNDKTPSGESGARMNWQQDSLEFFIDPYPANLDGEISQASQYNGKMAIISVLPYAKDGGKIVVGKNAKDLTMLKAENLEMTSVVTAEGYKINLTIPVKVFGYDSVTPGLAMGFDLGVNDAVGSKNSVSQLTWSTWGSHYRDRLSLGVIKFE